MSSPVLISCAPLVCALALAAVIDARQRRIPNWLTFGLMLSGLGRAAAGGGTAGLEHSLLGLLAGGALPLILYAISALGGGDVKLLAAIGAWLGSGPAVLVFMVEAVLGLIIVLVQATLQRRTAALFRNSVLIAANFASASEIGIQHAVDSGKSYQAIKRPLPFAVPVFFATLIVLWITVRLGR
jgi:prepilin peptidase CpaA